MPQHQPQQQHAPATGSSRPRSKAVPIVDPLTGLEVDLTDSKESAKVGFDRALSRTTSTLIAKFFLYSVAAGEKRRSRRSQARFRIL
jgi:hypothetical protein